MRRYSLTARRLILLIASTAIASLAVAASAQAVVINDNGYYGVQLVPGTSYGSLPAGVSVDTASGSCNDPALQFTQDLSYGQGSTPLCWRGGTVLHSNETFALTWDPYRAYWEGTRGYVEQFLQDVANGSGSLTSPFAVTTQYTDDAILTPGSPFLVTGRALNTSKYGGGCIDYGTGGGSDCSIGVGTSQGHDYPGAAAMGSCYVSGPSAPPCLTDSDIQGEVSQIASETQLTTHNQAGYSPVVVVLTPPGVEVCLDSGRTLCSANASSHPDFCSYHSQIDGIQYVVQPWTTYTGCDEPNLPTLPTDPTAPQLSNDAGSRLVGPLSEALIDTIVNPGVTDGWIAHDGSEMSDNDGCVPAGPQADTVTVGNNSYVLPREFDNAAAIESEPYTYFGCAPDVVLSPSFVVPSAIDAGDVVEFDGSATASTLLVPGAGYQWKFGDGTTTRGPSVEHSYQSGGIYNVTLTVTDRGGNTQILTQTIQVLGPDGQPTPGGGSAPATPVTPGSGSGSGGSLNVHLQLMPQSLKTVLAHGIGVRVSSNKAANGVATVWITRAAAKRAHISVGRAATVRIGIGTVSSITNGTVTLHLHLSKAMAKKLSHVRHVAMTIRLALVAAGNDQTAVDVAASY
jgi:hypothetical protein